MILCYRFITIVFYPIIICLIFFRKYFNKEDKKRYKEKIFSNYFSPVKRKKRKLIWFHAASIGEVQSIFPLIKKLNKKVNNYEFLITTVTLSSGNLVCKEFKNNKNIYHRYFPVDVNFLVKKFLDDWCPNLVLFVDSEIWPNVILEIKKRKIKLAMINARITKKSFKKWILFPNAAKKIFSCFDLCLVSNNETKNFLRKFHSKKIKYHGNLKLSGNVNFKKNIDINKNIFKNKKVWCAASTHKGEESECLKTHLALKKIYKNILTIIIPRHINRSNEIKFLCDKFELKSQVLKQNDSVKKDREILIVNSFGMLPKYFKYSKSVFIGKSIIENLKQVGGQNPIEAVKLGCKVYHGPFVYNFKEIYRLLKSWDVTEEVRNYKDLTKKLLYDFKNTKNNKDIISKKIIKLGNRILDNTIKEVRHLIV